MALSRIRQEDDEVLRDSLPYHWLKGLAQNEEEEARRRRHVAPPPPPPAEALAIIVPARRERGRRSFHLCRCPACDYEMSLEEGEKCNLMECPLCGTRMRALSTAEYRIAEGEAIPIVPLLFTVGALGLVAFLIAKRPFG